MTNEERPATADPSPAQIMQLAMGFMAAKHLFVANEIGLFRQLGDGKATLDDLAAKLGVPRRTVRISADAMAALGLIIRRGDEYENGPAASAFLSGRGPNDLSAGLRFFNRLSYPTWMGLEEAIRTGQAPNRQGGAFSEEDQRIFSQGVEAITAAETQSLAATYDFSAHRKILDLGGGTGSFLLPILHRFANIEATLFELPGAAAVARQRLEADAEGKRVRVVAGDFLADPVPEDHDAILVANVVHLFTPEKLRTLFGRVRSAANVGARLLIADFLTNSSQQSRYPLHSWLASSW